MQFLFDVFFWTETQTQNAHNELLWETAITMQYAGLYFQVNLGRIRLRKRCTF